MKAFVILTILFLSAYPILELTRCIILYNIIGGIGNKDIFYLELSVMWGLYICIPFVLNKALSG